VVVNFNGKRFLPGCMDSILRQTRPPDEVIVVDNGSTDGSLALLSTSYSSVRVYPLGRNTGLTHAYNVGLEKAGFDWVVLANNDIVLDERSLELIIDAATSSRIIATPRFVSIRPPHANQGFPVRFVPSLKHPWSSIKLDFSMAANTFSDIAGFGLLLVNRTAMGKIDERFPVYFGEDDFSLECRRRGLSIVFVPQSIVYHYGSGTIGKVSTRKIDLFLRGWLRFRIKWFPMWSLLPSTLFAVTLQAYQSLFELVGRPDLFAPDASPVRNSKDFVESRRTR
jgi:GT2 family glycosyltransferase